MKKIIAFAAVAALLLTVSASALAATGVGSVTSVTSAAAGEKDGSVSATTTMCAVTLDEEGKIVSASFDVVQSKGTFAADGALTCEPTAEPQTKNQLGAAYGMNKASSIGKDWFEQADALEAWCAGKTVAEVVTMSLNEKGAPTDADLVSGCTMGVGDMLKALELAAANAQ